MANLETALAEAGASLADVAKVTVFVAEHLQADLVVAWDAVTAAFGDHKPAGSLLGVSVLPTTTSWWRSRRSPRSRPDRVRWGRARARWIYSRTHASLAQW